MIKTIGMAALARVSSAFIVSSACIVLTACSSVAVKETVPEKRADISRLESVLATMPEDHKARHPYRNPKETLAIFGVKPGDTIVEILPGGGWYSQVLMPYLGAEGRLVGVDYDIDMFPHFGGFATPEFIEKRKNWPTEWTKEAKAWGDAAPSAYTFATLPEDLTGKADYILFIRALHNLARFESKGEYLTQALAETNRLLKPGGYVGVVQHEMAEEKPDAWAMGDRGYLKRSFVVEQMAAAGFELVAESPINKNPKDDVQDNETVWRLLPSLRVPDEQKAEYEAIGESNRMTLLFKKKS